MDDCIFCKIIKGEIPCSKVYEDDNVLAFLDIAPNNKGHSLVLPKKHYRNILDTPDDILQELIKAIKKVSNAVKEGVDAEGVNVIINNEPAAGQIVFHLHAHIIPRFENDGFKHWPGGKYEEGEMDETREKIKKYINKQ